MDNAKVMDALGHTTRARIVEELRKGGSLRVGDLCIILKLSQPTVSKHLKVMREANVVSSESYGSERWYQLNNKTLGHLTYWLTEMVPSAAIQPVPVPRPITHRVIDYSPFERGFAAV